MSMSPAEVASLRHMMGLSLDAFAALLEVNPRTVRAWESGRDALSSTSEAAVWELVRRHDALVSEYLDAEVPIAIRRDMGAAIPPRGWYLSAAGRAMHEEPDLMIGWLTDSDDAAVDE